MRRRFHLAAIFALVASGLSVDPTEAAPGDPSPRALATQVVQAGPYGESSAKNFEHFADLEANGLVAALKLTDPAATARAKEIAGQQMRTVPGKMFDAAVDAYVTKFSAQELTDILAFINSPAGQAEKVNKPLLDVDRFKFMGMNVTELGAAEEQAKGDLAGAPPARRELILRTVKAQRYLESRTPLFYIGIVQRSKGWRPFTAEERGRADDAMFIHFYRYHFTDAELAAYASYMESAAGRAESERRPSIMTAVSLAMANQYVAIYSTIEATVCSAISCSPEQRASLAREADRLKAAMTSHLP